MGTIYRINPFAYSEPTQQRKNTGAIRTSKRTNIVFQRSLDGVLPGPLPGSRLVPGTIGLVDVRDLGDERIVGVGVGEHRADREQD